MTRTIFGQFGTLAKCRPSPVPIWQLCTASPRRRQAGAGRGGGAQSIAFTMSSTTFLASPNTIIVLGM